MTDRTRHEIDLIDSANKDRKLQQNKVGHFIQWLQKCPVNYEEIQETSDDDIITINFYGKDIYKKTIILIEVTAILIYLMIQWLYLIIQYIESILE